MKNNKRHKLLFGRFAVVSLLIIAQVVLTLTFWLYIDNQEFLLNTRIVAIEIEVIILLVIINRYEPASYKLPWVCVILILPIAGIILYLMFASPKTAYKIKKRFAKARKEYEHYLPENDASPLALTDKDGANLSSYVFNKIKTPVYYGEECEYYPSGEKFFESLKTELKKAEKFIFIEYFIIGEGKMWNEIHEILLDKVKSGVKIFMLYDDVGSIGKIPNHFDAKIRKEGIICYKFNPFVPVLSGFLNNRDHRKITVIDGKVAFTGGVNIADEYINETHPFGVWKDTAVKICGKAANAYSMIFIELFNLYAANPLDPAEFMVKSDETDASDSANTPAAAEELKVTGEKMFDTIDEYLANAEMALARGEKDFERLDAAEISAESVTASDDSLNEKIAIQPFCDGPRPFYADTVAQNIYTNIIYSAKEYLYITTPYIIVDYSLSEAIKIAAERGVDVRIFTPHIPDKKSVFVMTRSNYEQFLKSGVKIYEYGEGFMHAKTLVSDDRIAVVGTVNLDYRSFVHHYECGAIFYGDKDSKLISDVKNDFLSTAAACGIMQNQETAKLNFFQKALKVIIGLFAPLL